MVAALSAVRSSGVSTLRPVGCEPASAKGIAVSLGVSPALRLFAFVLGVIASAYAWTFILPDQSASGSIAREASIVIAPKASFLRGADIVVDKSAPSISTATIAESAPIFRTASLATKDDPPSLPSLDLPRQPEIAIRETSYGLASYYSQGARTANGERFNARELTAAHRTLKFGTRVRVTNVATGKSVIVRINDRGPFIRGRVIDLSRSAAESLGMVGRGVAKVKVDVMG
jgi:rare lipoprotein A